MLDHTRLGLVATAVVVVAAAVLCVTNLVGCRRQTAPRAAAAKPVGPGAFTLFEPQLRAGLVNDLDEPGLRHWRRSQPLEHVLTGRVDSLPDELHVRPWLYTNLWIAQPVAKVRPDGTFAVRLYFDARYDAPFVITLELEDHSTGHVIATSDYFLRSAAAETRHGQ